MRSTAHLDRLRVQLRAVIAYRDAYGLSDVVADRINDLECLIAHETRRQERRAVQRSFVFPLSFFSFRMRAVS